MDRHSFDTSQPDKVHSGKAQPDLTVPSFDVQIGMWVVVDFAAEVQGKVISHKRGERKMYLGHAEKIRTTNEFTGRFLRPKAHSDGMQFVKTDFGKEDIADFNYRQLMGCTVRPGQLRRGVLKFDVNSKEW